MTIPGVDPQTGGCSLCGDVHCHGEDGDPGCFCSGCPWCRERYDLQAPTDREVVPCCALCIRPEERVRGCAQMRATLPCARCGKPTTGRVVRAAENHPRPAFVQIEIEPMGIQPNNTPSRPMCFSCGNEVGAAAVIHFSHAPRWDDAKRDSLVVLCALCLELAQMAVRLAASGKS